MLSFNRTCEPCQAKEQPTQAQQTVKPTPTPKVTRGTTTTTKTSCSACIDTCNQNTEHGKLPNQSSEQFACYANQCGVKGDAVFEEDGLPYCIDCEYYAEEAAWKVVKDEKPPYDGYMDAYSSIYSDCVKMNACSCGSNEGWIEDCKDCINRCSSGDTACLSKCKDNSGKACMSIETFADSCSTCQSNCGTDENCLKNCKDAAGKPCSSITLNVDSCSLCQSNCGSDENCQKNCKDAAGKPCMSSTVDMDSCTSCLEKCGDDNMPCQNACKNPVTGNSCIRIPSGTTGTSSGCLSCYQACVSSAKTKNSAGGTEKTTEAVLSCQQKCDQQYDTTIAGCACQGTVCPSGQHKELQTGGSLGCKCVNDITITFNTTDLSSQWTGHFTGTPAGTSTGSTTSPGSGTNCRDIPICCGDTPVCTVPGCIARICD
jgi:hypothetical protein